MPKLTIVVDVPDVLKATLEAGGAAMFIPILPEEREQIRSVFDGLVAIHDDLPKRLGTILEATEGAAQLGEVHRKSLAHMLHMSRLAGGAVDRLRIIIGRAQFILHSGSPKGGTLQ